MAIPQPLPRFTNQRKNDPAGYEVVNNSGVRFTCPSWWVSLLLPCKDVSHVIVQDLYTHNPESETEDVLITRYRGGLGDQICMIPAVEGLVEKYGKRLWVGVPEYYSPLFIGLGVHNEFIDTQKEEQQGGYYKFRLRFREVWDMYCPAGTYERSVNYDVRKSRVENFCEHVGVPVKTPHVWAKKGPDYFEGLPRPLIGFAPRAASWMKEWPISRVALLAKIFKNRGWTPVCFDDKFILDGVPSVFGLNIEQLGTVLSQIDLMVSIDSGLLHYAMAVGVPTLGLFGPTSGYHTMKVYPKGRFIQSFTDDICNRPCYYNTPDRNCYCGGAYGFKAIKGGIRKGIYTTCMKEITVDEVDEMVCRMLGISK